MATVFLRDSAVSSGRDRMRWACVGLLGGVLFASIGCGGRDDPEAAVASLIAAARAGDRAAVYARFGPRTRSRIDGLLSSAQRTGGTRMLRPEDLVTVGWLPPAWEHIRTRDPSTAPESRSISPVSPRVHARSA